MTQGALIGAVVDAGGYTTAFVVLGALLVLGGLAPFLLREPRTPLDPQGPRATGPDADATTPPGEPHAGVDAAAGTTGRPAPGDEPRRERARQATVAAARPLAVVACSVSR